jgi:dethiobiotin synthetase
MKSKAIFITGTDTGVGKTIVCGLLARYILGKGSRVITQKWIQTGSKNFSADIDVHLRLMGRKRKDFAEYLTYMVPYSFKFASSPHLAAGLERRKLSSDKVMRNFRFLLKNFDFVIVEGVGGVLVPYSRRNLVIDIVKELDLPILIVVKNRLGAINHALLTIEAIRARGMKILGIVFNSHCRSESETILRDNPRIIRKLTGEAILGNLPWSKDRDSLYRAFASIGDKILSKLIRNVKNG